MEETYRLDKAFMSAPSYWEVVVTDKSVEVIMRGPADIVALRVVIAPDGTMETDDWWGWGKG